jgi:hypothetical protein
MCCSSTSEAVVRDPLVLAARLGHTFILCVALELEQGTKIYESTHTYLFTYLRSWALLEELSIVQPFKNSPVFYGTRRFNTVFTRALHWSLFWAIFIQSTPFLPISLRSILILSPTYVLVFPVVSFLLAMRVHILLNNVIYGIQI